MTEETLQALERMAALTGEAHQLLRDGRTIEVTNHYGEYHYYRHLPANERHWSYFASLTRNEVLAILKDD